MDSFALVDYPHILYEYIKYVHPLYIFYVIIDLEDETGVQVLKPEHLFRL